MANKFNFDKVHDRWKNINMALSLANVAKNEFVNNFKVQGFGGNNWKNVKRREAGTPEYKYPKTKGISRRTKPILVLSGQLRRDVFNSVAKGHKNSNLSYTLVVENPYAGYLNEGTDKIDKRQFVGTTPELQNKIATKIKEITNKIWGN